MIMIISFVKRECVEGLHWRWQTVAIERTNSEKMFAEVRNS